MENSTELTFTTAGTSSNEIGTKMESLPAYQAGLLIWKIVPPLMLTFGTIGNVLSIMVLTKKSNRNNTSALYLSTLAVSDLVSLYTGLLRQWIIYMFNYDIRNIGFLICKIHLFFVYFSLDFSAWLLVAVTFDRVVKTCFPHVAKTTFTRKTAAISISTVGLVLLFLNCHVFYGMGTVATVTNYTTTVNECTYLSVKYKKFFQTVWPWLDFAVYSCLPFLLLLTGNLVIIVRLFKSFKATHTAKNKISSTSCTLIILNTVFLMSTTPVSIFLIGYPYWSENASSNKMAALNLIWSFVNILMYTNNAINFLLYCLSGSKFRKELKQIFQKCCKFK
ncbi:hypothetical protein KUTeg_018082 [Tegillarca granosa]|uniref:G-protein coupled receptors family 1 profile domain-containing protein n=1 Tax=Tegillarca granosa TaxID=220873 RepID=A0ABQ9EIA5_TEGGR|nr:hypothetical protein KUTeg_018082 [Tegillarca granosa]